MKKIFLAVAAFLPFTFFSSLGFAATCAEGRGFTLYCRGHYTVQNGGATSQTAFMDFTKNPTAAGSTGASLAAGSCAWEDRPLSQAEPSRVHYQITAANMGSQGWFEQVDHCAFDTSCTLEICVANNSTSTLLEVQSNQAIIRFP